MKTKKIISVLTVLCLSFTFALGQSVLIDHFIGQYTAEYRDVKLDIKQDSTYIMRINERENNYELSGRWLSISDDVIELTSSNYLCDIEHMNSSMQIVQKNDKSQDSIYFDFNIPSYFTHYPFYINVLINETCFVKTTSKFSIPKTALNKFNSLDSVRFEYNIYRIVPDFQLPYYIYNQGFRKQENFIRLKEYNYFNVHITSINLLNYSFLSTNKTIAYLDSKQILHVYNESFKKELPHKKLFQKGTQLLRDNLIGTYKNVLNPYLLIELGKRDYSLYYKGGVKSSKGSSGQWDIVHSNCIHLKSKEVDLHYLWIQESCGYRGCDYYSFTGIQKGSPDSLYFQIKYSPQGNRIRKEWKFKLLIELHTYLSDTIRLDTTLYSSYLDNSLLIVPKTEIHNSPVDELTFKFKPLLNIYQTSRRELFTLRSYYVSLLSYALRGALDGSDRLDSSEIRYDENANYFTLDLSKITDSWYDTVPLDDNVYVFPNGNLYFQGTTWEKQ